MKKISVIILLLIFSFRLNADPESCKFHWLLGEWESKSDKSTTVETWKWISEQTLEGKSITYDKDKNVKNSESLRLLKMEGEIFYLAKLKHNKLPIAFKLTKLTHSLAVFENPDHDFPTKLEYKLKDSENLIVTVSSSDKTFDVIYKKRSSE